MDLSSSALVGLSESARYLADYPYRCAEQNASRALAYLLSSDVDGAFAVSPVAPSTHRAQGIRSVNELFTYQCPSGGFSLWPGECWTQSAYLTAYVLHVSSVAKRMDVPVDANAIDRALDYLETEFNEPPPDLQWRSVWRRGGFEHVEKHDDRVLGFATRLGSGTHEFSYLVRATTAGTFGAAGAGVEAMYEPAYRGQPGGHDIRPMSRDGEHRAARIRLRPACGTICGSACACSGKTRHLRSRPR